MRCFLSAAFSLLSLASVAFAQSPDKAHWVWFPDGEPATEAKPGKAWFRAEVPMDGPCTGAAFVACDDKCTLWVNGQKIGVGGGEKSSFFILNGIVERGTNVIAIEAENVQGRAGLFVAGEIRNQNGSSIPFDIGTSSIDWKCTTTAPESDAWLKPRFDVSTWETPKDLGPHADSPWKAIEFGKNDLDRFQLPEGFSIQRIAEPELVGSVVCITWGNRGRLLVSPEGGPILSVWDSEGDGTLDKRTVYTDKVTNCQGLCMVFDDLYAVGNGPEGTGVYKLPDKNADDKADSLETITLHKGGMGEHGPHNVVFGPDGWLYHNLGNHAWIQETPQPESPVGKLYEGNLLEPRFEDAGGHAAGIKVPAGTIWRFSPDGKKWWLETAGFRNEYDIAFNSAGDLFTFDSDMEWDVGQPWYRPVRINHCIPGADFGWRSGTANWPEYYFDSLPGTVNIGRGSPTGIVFYEHRQLPEKYRGALLACDWSMGRILAVFLQPSDSTYYGTFETLVAGNPLNVSDIEVDRDGSIVFSTGGRGTQGGVYRVSYSDPSRASSPSRDREGAADSVASSDIDALFAIPQFSSAWAREDALRIKEKLGGRWASTLIEKAKTGTPYEQFRALTALSQLGPKPETRLLVDLTTDDDAPVRAFAIWLLGGHQGKEVASALSKRLEQADEDRTVQRRACEAFVRSGIEAPAKHVVLNPLTSYDRWLRYAARLALERIPSDKWRDSILKSRLHCVTTHGLLALHRRGELQPKELFLKTAGGLWGGEGSRPEDMLDSLRLLQLAALAGPEDEIRKLYGEELAIYRLGLRGVFETWRVDLVHLEKEKQKEFARLFAALNWTEVPDALSDAIHRHSDQTIQMHFALCLAYVTTGWTAESRCRLLDWYETTRDWEGGNSLQGNIANIVGASIQRFPKEDRKELLLTWQKRPHAMGLLLRLSKPEDIDDFEAVVAKIVEDVEKDPANPAGGEILASLTSALAASPAESSKATLRKLFDEHPDHRETLARALAAHPQPADFPYFVSSLKFGSEATLQITLQALNRLEQKPEEAEDYRAAILAGLKLGERGEVACSLLAKWAGLERETIAKPQLEIPRYQKWYAEKFPDAPPAELPQAAEGAKYSLADLVNFLENDPRGQRGDVPRGQAAFKKANCAKCHKFGAEGTGVGPDLTSVRRRFQRSEIIESLVLPSAVISDQFKSISVETKDGLAYTGMPIPQPGTKNLVLLLPDATKLEIPSDQIAAQAPAKISVMPTDVLKDLSLEEIADLFAFLETSKSNPLTTTETRSH